MAAFDEPRFLAAGDRCVVVEFGDGIDAQVNARARALARRLQALQHPGVIETVPTYRSVLVHVDPLTVDPADIEALIRTLDLVRDADPSPPARVVDIPCAYGGAFGPDLPDVAAHAGLSEEEVVAIHASAEYLVYMMGFTPGFPYLGGMSPRIAAPRLATPRTIVPAGSVGIAAEQTGIYPIESPGGWRLIGRTPVRLFDALRQPPVWFDAGDYVRFLPIGGDEYAQVRGEVESGTYVPRTGVRT